MKQQKLSVFALFLLLSVLLISCGGQAESIATPEECYKELVLLKKELNDIPLNITKIASANTSVDKKSDIFKSQNNKIRISFAHDEKAITETAFPFDSKVSEEQIYQHITQLDSGETFSVYTDGTKIHNEYYDPYNSCFEFFPLISRELFDIVEDIYLYEKFEEKGITVYVITPKDKMLSGLNETYAANPIEAAHVDITFTRKRLSESHRIYVKDRKVIKTESHYEEIYRLESGEETKCTQTSVAEYTYNS